MIFYIWVVALLAALALYFRQFYSRFRKCGVKHKTPLPLIGNMGPMLFRMKHFVGMIDDLFKDFPEERFIGHYEFTHPTIYIKDLELIKKITIKDLEHFIDHRPFVSEKMDPFFGRNLFSLKGQEWKDMRSTLSPAFTSSKMKHMLPFMVEVGDQMISSLNTKLEQAKTNAIDFDARDLSTRFTNDVIASCAFGLRVDSLTELDNEFYKMGYKASNFTFVQILKMMGYSCVPNFMEKMKVRLFPLDVRDFFVHLVTSTMHDRETHSILRPDMIHLLMEAKKGRLICDEKSGKDADAGFATVEESTIGKKSVSRAWSDNDLIAQAALFFLAGFDTVATAMTLLLYELAVNPEVQEKLAQEIKDNVKISCGKFDYNSIQTMAYMDMVVSEVLRLWPPAAATDRICVKDYNLGRPNDKATEDYIIKKGEGLNIPIAAIHRDPQFFPNPMKFDPERFSDENKRNIKPFTYMPFGAGPRNCIGSRFALYEIKVMVYQFLQHMKVEPSEKTPIPAELSTESFNLRLKGGHWLRLKARN